MIIVELPLPLTASLHSASLPCKRGRENAGRSDRRPLLTPTEWGRGGSGEPRDGEGMIPAIADKFLRRGEHA